MLRYLAMLTFALACPVWAAVLASSSYAADGVTPGSDRWSIWLNVLKIGGILVTIIASLIGSVSETKTETKKLTTAGRLLLIIGLFGGVLAIGAQALDWWKSDEESRTANLRNARLLTEIQRAVTRLDSISVSTRLRLPIFDPLMKPYSDDFNSRLRAFLDDLNIPGEISNGLQPLSIVGDEVHVFRIPIGSPALPNAEAHGAAGYYAERAYPSIALYRHPIDPKKFNTIGFPPDLVLHVSGGVTMSDPMVPPDLARRVDGRYWLPLRNRVEILKDTWNPTGALVSIKDLEGAQAIIFQTNEIAGRRFSAFWAATEVYEITLYLNSVPHVIKLDSSNRHEDGFGRLIYTYVFPPRSDP